jgi:beta-lactam-binding protein with PASTA domain
VSAAAEPVDADGTKRMPDLAGKTLRQALGALEPLGVEVRLAGQGRIVRQMPAAGEPVEPGAVARLTLTSAAGAGSPCEARRVDRHGEGARAEASCNRGER